MTSFQGCHVPRHSMVLYFEDVRAKVVNLTVYTDSFNSCSERIDVWSESGSKLEEEIFKVQSKMLFLLLNLLDA